MTENPLAYARMMHPACHVPADCEECGDCRCEEALTLVEMAGALTMSAADRAEALRLLCEDLAHEGHHEQAKRIRRKNLSILCRCYPYKRNPVNPNCPLHGAGSEE